MSIAEENYLKAIFHLGEESEGRTGTNAIAQFMQTSAASVTDMVQRLADKKLVSYEKYKGVALTTKGRDKAKEMIRNHRLWEVFLVEKLSFGWDEIHPIAEELEHIKSKELIQRLDEFLGYPKFDPHGDPIPDSSGKITYRSQTLLSELKAPAEAILVGVKDSSADFLQYLDEIKLGLGARISIKSIYKFDKSMQLHVADRDFVVSHQVSSNLYVTAV